MQKLSGKRNGGRKDRKRDRETGSRIALLAYFNAFFHQTEHPGRICLYLVRQFEAELTKMGIFRFQSHFLRPNMIQSSWNQHSYFHIKLGEQFSLKALFFLTILVKLCLVKMCPIFVRSQLSCLARYQKILWKCSFQCKNLLNFACLTMELHNSHHSSPDFSLKQNHKSIDIFFQLVLPKSSTSCIFLYPGKKSGSTCYC